MINKIFNHKELKIDNPERFEFIIKEEDKVIYQNYSYAGVVCTVEKVDAVDENFEITGRTQRFVFGHPIVAWFAYDQLGQTMKKEFNKVLILITDQAKKHPRAAKNMENYFKKLFQ